MWRCFQFLPWLLLSALAWADGPSDLRISLQRLRGQAPVQASLQYSVWQERTTFLTPVIHARSLHLQMEEDAAGLHVDWRFPEAETPEVAGIAGATPLPEILNDLDALSLAGLLNQARPLSQLLEDTRFKAEGQEIYEGRPVRMLTFTCRPGILPQHRGRIVQAEAILRIWIEDDGVPLAMESMTDYDGRHSRLYGRIHSHSRVRTTFAVLGQRLIASSRTSEDFLYDGGDRLKTRKTFRLTVPD